MDNKYASEPNRSYFTDGQREIIEALILRQIVAYNRKLREAGVVSFEYGLTDAQKEVLDDCGIVTSKPFI